MKDIYFNTILKTYKKWPKYWQIFYVQLPAGIPSEIKTIYKVSIYSIIETILQFVSIFLQFVYNFYQEDIIQDSVIERKKS